MHKVTLKESARRHMMERTPRYDVLLNGQRVGELYFNMRGYRGTLPLPGGRSFDIGERSLSEFKRTVAAINRGEFN